MPKAQKVLISLDETLVESLDDFRFKNRFESRSEAIRFLLDYALKQKPKIDPQRH